MKQHSPAAERNAAPILDVLRRVLPGRGTVLEVASGSGQHALAIAREFPDLTIQPTDVDRDARLSIDAFRREAELPNLLGALELDATRQPWPVEDCDAVVCINLLQVAPWSATVGLMDGASATLPATAKLVIYGPLNHDGDYTSKGNEEFDRSLKSRNGAWGLRDVVEIARVGQRVGFALSETIPMPANNTTLVFTRTEEPT